MVSVIGNVCLCGEDGYCYDDNDSSGDANEGIVRAAWCQDVANTKQYVSRNWLVLNSFISVSYIF